MSSRLFTGAGQDEVEPPTPSRTEAIPVSAELMPFEPTNGSPKPLHPKRVLFFGKKKSRTRCTGALVEALRSKGLTVKWINCALLKRWMGNRGARWAVRMIRKRLRPDLCFVFFHDLPPLLMQEIAEEVPTVVWMEEGLGPKTDPRVAGEALADYVRSARLLCVSTPELVRAYRSVGVENATFLMSGFSPRYHRPLPEFFGRRRYDRDIAFIGAPGYMGDRPTFLAWLSERHQLDIFGRKDSWLPYLRRYPQLNLVGEVRPAGYAKVCARSRIVLGLNQTHQHALYFSNRVFLTLACGGFHLTHYVPGMEAEMQDGEHLAWFRDREECCAKIEHWLTREEERLRVARAGYELVMSRHRYESMVEQLLGILATKRELSCPLVPADELVERTTEQFSASDAEEAGHASDETVLYPSPARNKGSGSGILRR